MVLINISNGWYSWVISNVNINYNKHIPNSYIIRHKSNITLNGLYMDQFVGNDGDKVSQIDW